MVIVVVVVVVVGVVVVVVVAVVVFVVVVFVVVAVVELFPAPLLVAGQLAEMLRFFAVVVVVLATITRGNRASRFPHELDT